jgi:hypothetical protein
MQSRLPQASANAQRLVREERQGRKEKKEMLNPSVLIQTRHSLKTILQ